MMSIWSSCWNACALVGYVLLYLVYFVAVWNVCFWCTLCWAFPMSCRFSPTKQNGTSCLFTNLGIHVWLLQFLAPTFWVSILQDKVASLTCPDFPGPVSVMTRNFAKLVDTFVSRAEILPQRHFAWRWYPNDADRSTNCFKRSTVRTSTIIKRNLTPSDQFTLGQRCSESMHCLILPLFYKSRPGQCEVASLRKVKPSKPFEVLMRIKN
jgi:hypothetical protein